MHQSVQYVRVHVLPKQVLVVIVIAYISVGQKRRSRYTCSLLKYKVRGMYAGKCAASAVRKV